MIALRRDTQHKFLCLSALIFFVSIFSWINPPFSALDYVRKDATGFKTHNANLFFYFYNVLGLFPLAAEPVVLEKLELEANVASAFIQENPKSLRMEMDHWYRFGEHARIWALYPDHLFTGKSVDLRLLPFNLLVLLLTMLALIFALAQRFGLIIAFTGGALVASSPFLVAESFLRDNIFALHPLTHILLISLMLIVWDRHYVIKLLIVLLSGLWVSTASEIRGENLTGLAVIVLFCFFTPSVGFRQRLLLFVMGLSLVFLSKFVIQSYFDEKYVQTKAQVEAVGGVPFEGVRTKGHPIWHPLVAGLGDFGTDRGFVWSDLDVWKKVSERSGLNVIKNREAYYDPGTEYYYKRMETLDGYARAARGLFYDAISSDPVWYSGILIKRAVRIFHQIPPIRLNFFSWALSVNFWVLFTVLSLIAVLRQPDRLFKKPSRIESFVLLAALSMSATTFLIHSGRGATYSGMFQYWIIIMMIGRLSSGLFNIKLKGCSY